jgi:hypothetical protein
MRHAAHNAGFSLMEVNMAVFVMAIGILGMVALFPLGLREGVQARADLKQAMFADHALNQIVAVLSQTNMTWTVWKKLDGFSGNGNALQGELSGISSLMPSQLSGGSVNLGSTIPGVWTVGVGAIPLANGHFHITCGTPKDTPSARILGITVRSADTDDTRTSNEREGWDARHVPFYAEVLFNGDPMK